VKSYASTMTMGLYSGDKIHDVVVASLMTKLRAGCPMDNTHSGARGAQ
jgi:hypothetical protein